MKRLFAGIASNQEQNGTPEAVRAYARQQFEKRLARIARAREQSPEQIDQLVAGEKSAEAEAETA